MEHAEVLSRVSDAAAMPSGLGQLETDGSADGMALRQHLKTCSTCRAEYAAWQLTSAALLDATPDTMRAPAEARDRILSAVLRDGVPRGAAASPNVAQIPVSSAAPLTVVADVIRAQPAAASDVMRADVMRANVMRAEVPPLPLAAVPMAPADAARRGTSASAPTPIRRPSPVSFRRLALAAAAVLVVFVAGAVLGPRLGLTPPDHAASALVGAVQASDQILRQPGHREAVLTRSDGTSAGAVLVNPATGDIVIISSDLDAGDSSDYHCYLVRGAAPAMWIGPMLTQDGTSYWAGTVTGVANLGSPGDVIQIMDGGGAPDITATF